MSSSHGGSSCALRLRQNGLFNGEESVDISWSRVGTHAYTHLLDLVLKTSSMGIEEQCE